MSVLPETTRTGPACSTTASSPPRRSRPRIPRSAPLRLRGGGEPSTPRRRPPLRASRGLRGNSTRLVSTCPAESEPPGTCGHVLQHRGRPVDGHHAGRTERPGESAGADARPAADVDRRRTFTPRCRQSCCQDRVPLGHQPRPTPRLELGELRRHRRLEGVVVIDGVLVVVVPVHGENVARRHCGPIRRNRKRSGTALDDSGPQRVRAGEAEQLRARVEAARPASPARLDRAMLDEDARVDEVAAAPRSRTSTGWRARPPRSAR